MNQFSYDVAAAYKIYYKMSKNPPPIFPDNKFKLAELCFQSFKNSLTGLRVKLWVILNDCPPEYEAMIQRVWGVEDLTIIKFPGVGNMITTTEQVRHLTAQTAAELVCLSDDDYFYRPGQFHRAVDFLRQNLDVDFVTLHDHPDGYNTDLHKLPIQTRVLADQNWCSCLSTCHTYLTRRSVMIEIQGMYWDMLKQFKDVGGHDLPFWMALTKKRVFNPFKFVRWVLTRRWFWAVSMVMAWYYCGRQVLFGRRYSLWVARPSLATHMDAKLLAHGIDWQKEFQKQIASTKSENRKN